MVYRKINKHHPNKANQRKKDREQDQHGMQEPLPTVLLLLYLLRNTSEESMANELTLDKPLLIFGRSVCVNIFGITPIF